ncbi:MAG: peptidase M38 [Rhizobiales bacterium]|nr:peptidase M38 [Hyphomicrobiales bacterium]
MPTILTNANLLDVDAGEIVGVRHIVIEGNRIKEISDTPVTGSGDVIDLKGKTLMPGLIDAHVHISAYTANLADLPYQSPFYVAARTIEILGGMLDRSFTTVRDVGGGEFGMARAQAEGSVRGPRIYFGGKALSPSSGHGDMRKPGQDTQDAGYSVPSLGRICNGVDEVRSAARDEIRRGANHIKIMANGGIASPTDRIDSDQFSEDEISAIVDEASMANIYVVAHAYTARSVERAVRNGVRSIEHGNLLDENTVGFMKEKGAYLVPTLATYRGLKDEGVAAGLPTALAAKIDKVLDAGIRAVEMAHRAGVPMAYGTDLLGAMHYRQLTEFDLRGGVVPAADLLRSATVTGAALLQCEGEIGRIAPGYLADLIAFEGDPLADISIMGRLAETLALVMQDGKVVRSAF